MASVKEAPEEKPSILFVDDEVPLLRAISRVLKGCSLEVVIASSPSEALDILGQRRIDVVVSDIDMPEMSGLELLDIVRMRHPSALRMVLTGAASLERVLHAVNEGEVVRFFVKPFDSILFRETIASLAGRIERARRDDASNASRTRAHALHRWLGRRYPRLCEVERDADERVVISVESLSDRVEQSGSLLAARLLGSGRNSG